MTVKLLRNDQSPSTTEQPKQEQRERNVTEQGDFAGIVFGSFLEASAAVGGKNGEPEHHRRKAMAIRAGAYDKLLLPYVVSDRLPEQRDIVANRHDDYADELEKWKRK